ncbi:mannosylglucosyl-3-phosphoglycerate phosphatase-like [Saccostrea echinata]|uniref:mannosylglucosyl-3-phosphoglycerate phosphatase-like n=1 Tax=Saccostrea echinata TaxID=191078 RepID=UPI002A7F2C25|nr:mannosylglucosyl-3-phosphoglycerate phosphatase-like [Saccostrea echinata]
MPQNDLVILHFNDVYNLEPQKDEPVGGAARFVGCVKSYQSLNPLVLFSGDVLNPSLLSIFLKGEQMIPILNAVGTHAAVFGNHDFDFGVDHLCEMTEKTKFPWLLSNVTDNLTKKSLADGQESCVIEWNGYKVGVIGLVEEEWIDTLATLDPEDVTYIDFVSKGKELCKDLKQKGVDLIVALTHMRWPNDRHLAEQVPDIDIILAGHDHDYGLEIVNDINIVKSGTDFRNLSKITIKRNGLRLHVDIEKVDVTSNITEDPETLEIVKHMQGDINSKMEEVLGYMNVELDGRFSAIRSRETNLGNFVTDIMLEISQADCAILNSGTFRSDRIHPKGRFKLRDLLTILPLVDELVVIEVTGKQLIKALENGVSAYPKLEGRFPQVAGITFGFNPSKPKGQRVDPELVKVQGQFIDLKKKYKLCTKEYLSEGKDGYDVFKNCPVLVTSEQCCSLSTGVRNHFESIQIMKGVKECKSGHRQSLVGLVRKRGLVQKFISNLRKRSMARKLDQAATMSKLERRLSRQKSVYNEEEEQCHLSPEVEGRIILLDDQIQTEMLEQKMQALTLCKEVDLEEEGDTVIANHSLLM